MRTLAALCIAGALLALEGGNVSPANGRTADRSEIRSVAPVPVPGSVVPRASGVARMTALAIVPRGPSILVDEMAPDRGSVLIAPEAAGLHVVTLAPFVPRRGQTKWEPLEMTLFGSSEDAWRVQVGPRMELGRNAGLTLHGGTQGQNNHWDLGASATVGARPNLQGVVRFHP